MTAPDHESFRRAFRAFDQVRAANERLMRDIAEGRHPGASLERAIESAERVRHALQAWEATYPGIVGYRSA